MTNRTFTKLTNLVSEVVSQTLSQAEADQVVSAWEKHKAEVNRMVANNSKPKKDPNAPKKPKSGYLFFCASERKNVQQKNPTLSNTELTSKLGANWQALTDAQKNKYNELAKKDKLRYEKEMESYVPPVSASPEQDTASGKRRTRRAKQDPDNKGPKRPLSAYMYYCTSARAELKNECPDMKGKDVMVELGRRWNAMSEQEKSPYLEQQAKDKERYAREKASGVVEATPAPVQTKSGKTKFTEEAPTPVRTATPSKTKAPPVPASKPKTSSKSTPGFECYCNEQRGDLEDEHPTWNPSKVKAELTKQWKELTDEDREVYEKEATETLDEEVELEDD